MLSPLCRAPLESYNRAAPDSPLAIANAKVFLYCGDGHMAPRLPSCDVGLDGRKKEGKEMETTVLVRTGTSRIVVCLGEDTSRNSQLIFLALVCCISYSVMKTGILPSFPYATLQDSCRPSSVAGAQYAMSQYFCGRSIGYVLASTHDFLQPVRRPGQDPSSTEEVLVFTFGVL